MLKRGSIYLATTTLISISALAANNTSNLNLSSSQSKSNFYGDVSLAANQLVGDVGEVPGNKFQADLTVGYRVPYTQSKVKKNFELRLRANDKKNIMFSIKEAYLQSDLAGGVARLGRFNLEWNKLDENWSLGKLNNRVNFDGFEPDQEGLVGFSYKRNVSQSVKLEGFVSYLYVPELNPSRKIDKENGTITCNNPWCSPLNQTTKLSGRDVPIFYDVNIPDLGEIVFNYSTAMRASLEVNKLEVSSFVARKPENSISTRVEVSSDDGALSQLNAEVTPEVYYHSLFGVDAKFVANKNISFNASSIFIRPDDNPVENPDDFINLGLKPKKTNEDYLGAGVDYINRGLKGSFNYIARVSEFDKEGDPLIEYPRWNQAVHLSLNSQVTRKVAVGLDYKYDMLTEDRLTMFRANYQYSPRLLTSFGVNMIGSDSDGQSYWSKYTNNDSVYGSLKYSF